MKPHALVIEAFGPYAGRVAIDFDALSDDGVFLIHGSTGAGKTFLLDAISFALYGEVPGERGVKGLRSDHAPPQAVPRVELDFSAGGARYRVERTPAYTAAKQRGSGTTDKQATAALLRVQGAEHQPVATRTSEVNREVEAIVGLNAAQFRQVILLPQGRFAEVLRARAEEREALLKTLFATVIHERASDWLEDQARAAWREVEEQKRQLNWLRRQAAQEWEPFAQRGLASGTDGAGTAASLAGSAAAADGEVRSHPLADPDADAQPGGVDPADLRDPASASDPAPFSESTDPTQPADPADPAELGGPGGLGRAAQGSAAVPPADQAGLDQLLLQIRQVVALSEEARRQASELLERARQHRTALVQAADRFDRRAAALAALAELEPQRPQFEALALQLAVADRAEALRPSLEADQVARRELQALELRLNRELQRAASVREGALGLPDAVVALSLQSLPESLELQRCSTALATRRVEVEGLARQAEEGRQARERSARAALLQRQALEQLDQARQQLQGLRQEREEAEAAHQAARSAVDRLDGLTQAKDSLAARALAARQVRKGRRLEGEALASLRAVEERLQQATTLLRSLRDRKLAGMAARLADGLTDGSPCPVCGSAHHPQPARSAADAVDDAQIEAAEAALTGLGQKRQDAAVHLADLRGRLEAALEKAGEAAQDPNAAQVAADQAEQVLITTRQQAERLPDLDRSLAELARRLTALEASQQQASTTAAVQERSAADDRQRALALEGAVAAALGVGVAPRSVLEGLSVVDEAFETLARSSDAAARLRTRQEQAAARLARDLEAAGFADGTALAAALQDGTVRADWRRRIDAFHAALSSQRTLLAAPDLQDLPEQRPDTAAAEAAEAAADRARTAAVERHSEARSAEEDIERLWEEHRRLAGTLVDQESRASLLAAVANRCQGKTAPFISLQRWVLSAYLAEICAYANQRLDLMTSGRYQLRLTDAGGRGGKNAGLNLRVHDAFTGEEREVTSLSGGETFQASLALALGVADTVQAHSGGVHLDALFVDEGFGSLDPDNLQLAMDELDRLREGGRLIGVISHVAALRERIRSGIEVIATDQGSSLRVGITPMP